eukprot:358763-Chlamydomonas_euryale.AAC.5
MHSSAACHKPLLRWPWRWPASKCLFVFKAVLHISSAFHASELADSMLFCPRELDFRVLGLFSRVGADPGAPTGLPSMLALYCLKKTFASRTLYAL